MSPANSLGFTKREEEVVQHTHNGRGGAHWRVGELGDNTNTMPFTNEKRSCMHESVHMHLYVFHCVCTCSMTLRLYVYVIVFWRVSVNCHVTLRVHVPKQYILWP